MDILYLKMSVQESRRTQARNEITDMRLRIVVEEKVATFIMHKLTHSFHPQLLYGLHLKSLRS